MLKPYTLGNNLRLREGLRRGPFHARVPASLFAKGLFWHNVFATVFVFNLVGTKFTTLSWPHLRGLFFPFHSHILGGFPFMATSRDVAPWTTFSRSHIFPLMGTSSYIFSFIGTYSPSWGHLPFPKSFPHVAENVFDCAGLCPIFLISLWVTDMAGISHEKRMEA